MVGLAKRISDWMFPKNAAERDQRRFLSEYSRRVFSRYDAAQTTPENELYWVNADSLSANAANDPGIRCKLRNRSRYECHESNSYAKGLVLTRTVDVIGNGPRLRLDTTDIEANRAIEQRWQAWSSEIGLARKLRTLYMAKMVDGESFAERVQNEALRDAVQLDVKLSEADMWTNQNTSFLQQANESDGIFFDSNSNPIQYTRLRVHPGDRQFAISNFGQADTISADNVIHWFRADRPDQRRGIPELTPALPLFAELRRYRLAVIASAETAAHFSAVMYSDSPTFSEATDMDDLPTIDLKRRTMVTLPGGWKIEQLRAEQPTTAFNAFTDGIIQEIGRVVQMPLNIIGGSSKDSNFSSAQMDWILYYNSCEIERSDCVSQVLDRIFSWWLDEALLIPGYLPRLGSFEALPHRWVFAPRRPINPLQQAQADEIYFNLGWLTDQMYDAREALGGVLWQQQSEMRDMRTETGFPLPNGGNRNALSQPSDQTTNEAPAKAA